MYTSMVKANPKNKILSKKLSFFFLCGIPTVTVIFDVNIADPFNVIKLIILILVSSWLLVDLLYGLAIKPLEKKSIQFKVIFMVFVFGVTQFILFFLSPNLTVADAETATCPLVGSEVPPVAVTVTVPPIAGI